MLIDKKKLHLYLKNSGIIFDFNGHKLNLPELTMEEFFESLEQDTKTIEWQNNICFGSGTLNYHLNDGDLFNIPMGT